MHLTEPQSLTAGYTDEEVDEMIVVMQSTALSTPSAVLRWGKVDHADMTAWLKKGCAKALQQQFQLERITGMPLDHGIPTDPYAEHLVIRDLDMPHLYSTGQGISEGHVVAHADFRYTPAYGVALRVPGGTNSTTDTSAAYPPGFEKELHLLLNNKVESTLDHVFHGLPCFSLDGISTLTPSHLRQGIGKKLVEWVYPYAEKLGLPVVLAASPMGLFLYRKCGFEEYRQHDIVIDLTKYGGEDLHRHVIMVRWPTDLDRLPSAWKAWKQQNDVKP